MALDISRSVGDTGLKGKTFIYNSRYSNANFLGFIQFSFLILNVHRLWWIIAFGVSVYFCVSSIRSILNNWNEHSVTMNMAERPAHISAIPFPQVTVCVKPKVHLANLNLTKKEDFWKKTHSEKRYDVTEVQI